MKTKKHYKHSFVIKIKKRVCTMSNVVLEPGEVYIAHTNLDLSDSNLNGAKFKFDNVPYEKFLWSDEFEVIRKFKPL